MELYGGNQLEYVLLHKIHFNVVSLILKLLNCGVLYMLYLAIGYDTL